MQITPLTGALGAEIQGIDLKSLDSETSRQIEHAFAEYLVLVFRDQDLTPADLMTLTHHFGGPGETPYLEGLPDYPDVVPVIKEAKEKSQHSFGAGWHTDFTFQEHPPARTLLYAVDTPPTGGDTLYANQYDAYDALSEGMKSSLDGLMAIHSAVRSYGPKATLKDHMEHMTITNDAKEPQTRLHPVVRRHPVTDKPALWVNPTYTIRFKDMTEEESNTLLHYLNALIISPSHTCRVKWRPGTLTMWDNRCTQHCATSDYRGHRREMWRTTTAGEIPSAYTKDC
ncbi:MAG: TauD/TfdA family dioxygenase [Pseudomonadales bacterium]|nr:TauD/TfdA family dioxygenase [Pseudomonadales bacterium]MBO7005358.1 TauD/TfdA family dioxygenase [Pseudomonadales bacterium]